MSPAAGRDLYRFWAAALGDAASVAPGLGRPDLSHAPAGGQALSIWPGDQADSIRIAQDETALVLVEGPSHSLLATNPAEAILGADPTRRLAVAQAADRPLTTLVRDAASGTVLCTRDPLGVQPLFYTERAGGVVVSPSPELLAHSGAGAPAPDRVALAEWVTTYATPMDRTLYAGVTRVPAGHALIVQRGVAAVFRYWSPEIARPSDRIDEEEALARFEAAFDRAIERAAAGRRCAVFLSGGIDSSLTAAALAQHHRAHGLEPPLALSLKFPHPGEDEEARARAMATALGLTHVVVPLGEAMGGQGILAAGIEAGEHSWYPSPNPWSAAYHHLAAEAGRRGCEAAFNGEGGNDLLETPWELAADLIRGGELHALEGFSRAQAAYYGGRSRDYYRDLLWRRGLTALVRPVVHRALLEIAPGAARVVRTHRAERSIPAWALPDEGLRREVIGVRASFPAPLSPTDLHGYVRSRFLDDPLTSIVLDGIYQASRHSSVQTLSAYLDPALVGLVLALPARSLQYGERAKGLAFASLAKRVDATLASALVPTTANRSAIAALVEGADGAIAALGGFPRLAALGIVSERAALAVCSSAATAHGTSSPHSWHLMATEGWLQSHSL